jgi:hypothetical protein
MPGMTEAFTLPGSLPASGRGSLAGAAALGAFTLPAFALPAFALPALGRHALAADTSR